MDVPSIDGWPPIQLAWRQKVAAFWSIFWLPFIASWSLVMFVSFELISTHPTIFFWVSQLMYFLFQAAIVRRLYTKRYASFRIAIVREENLASTKLMNAEAAIFAIRIALPQILFIVFVALLAALFSANDQRLFRGISSLSVWGRILVVGPYTTQFALNSAYKTFRLQAFGQRYI